MTGGNLVNRDLLDIRAKKAHKEGLDPLDPSVYLDQAAREVKWDKLDHLVK